MTKEEAITILENGEWWEIISGVLPHNDAERIELQEAVHVAISALRAQVDTPPNAPLTLKELREMDGEPVWSARWGVWGLVDIGFSAVITRKGNLDINDDGIHERLYRRKPEEGTV